MRGMEVAMLKWHQDWDRLWILCRGCTIRMSRTRFWAWTSSSDAGWERPRPSPTRRCKRTRRLALRVQSGPRTTAAPPPAPSHPTPEAVSLLPNAHGGNGELDFNRNWVSNQHLTTSNQTTKGGRQIKYAF